MVFPDQIVVVDCPEDLLLLKRAGVCIAMTSLSVSKQSGARTEGTEAIRLENKISCSGTFAYQ